jgi:hydroxyacylglutathione hydrolase
VEPVAASEKAKAGAGGGTIQFKIFDSPDEGPCWAYTGTVFFERFYLTCLSHASYMIGSGGIAAVVDPQRDIGLYLETAAANGLDIQHIIESHLHADFVSGHKELAAMTGAAIYIGAAAGAQFPHVAVREGMEVSFGQCRLRFLETPGHTLESISILVTDLERSSEPYAVLTGDTLFIGDVGRPDLSGEAAPRELAGMLYDSLHWKLLRLADDIEVYPAHGAGSLCGRALSADSSSTIGKERRNNYALRIKDRDAFIRTMTADLPERPEYFARDVEINRAGAAPLDALPPLRELSSFELLDLQRRGAVVLDTRPANEFAAAHVPGSLHIGLRGQYASWAGILLGLDTEIVLVAEDPEAAEESRMRLARVGIEKVRGTLEDGIAGWNRDGQAVGGIRQVPVTEFHQTFAHGVQLIDVRRAPEWEEGHLERAIHRPLDKLRKSVEDLDRNRPTAAYCKGGYRSSIATSILRQEGFTDVANIVGGYDAWKACGLPVVTG